MQGKTAAQHAQQELDEEEFLEEVARIKALLKHRYARFARMRKAWALIREAFNVLIAS
jgi:hypothetical protein